MAMSERSKGFRFKGSLSGISSVAGMNFLPCFPLEIQRQTTGL